ncbi:hypothetical protein GH714_035796 [Hevea brasiliensis]|uniref:Uncharacterized protein n=1 Tax=Hevea brasiliensis TaxID=3981 RepID=A0A6A6NKN9_HEVBR|nr:hypothetical protein GH714_035796 [Hevea brasiliensis]
MEDKLKKNEDSRQEEDLMVLKNHSLEEEQSVGRLPQEPMKRQVNLRSNTLASNRMSNAVQGNTRRDKLKRLKSVQQQFHVAESDEPFNNIEFVKTANKIGVPENFHKGDLNYISSEKQKTTNHHSDNKVQLKSEVEMLEKELSEAAAEEVGLYPAVVRHGNSTNKVQLIEKAREIDAPGDIHKVDESCALSEREQTESSFSGLKVELESKVEMLKEELMEAAVLEVNFLVVKFNCAESNCKSVVEKLQLVSALSIIENGGQKGSCEASPYEDEKIDKSKGSDEWEESQTFIVALERVEAWIFSRIVESVWWQTLTPHMQPTAVKGSNSKKTYARRYGLGNQEQGNFAIDLWKKAFKDACERLCPIRSGGHECGCLPVLARLVMEQLVHRLDVAMFNAILRESADDMPTDPVSDPISDPKVLPIPAGKSSFGAGTTEKCCE